MSFSLPNFFFHATTAYDILRHNGAPLGKRDFMGKLEMEGVTSTLSFQVQPRVARQITIPIEAICEAVTRPTGTTSSLLCRGRRSPLPQSMP